MNRNIFILLIIFLISRLIFINPLPVFFDSPEYLSRFSNPNYFQAIASGHIPFHITYIAFFWPFFQVALYFKINPAQTVILVQILLSAIAVYCFYRFVVEITDKKTAIISTVIAISFPIYWITNVTLMQESTYINFFFISAFLLISYVKDAKKSVLLLFAGCTSLGLSLLSNSLILLWLPFLLSIIFFMKKRKFIKIFLTIAITFCLSILINGLFVFKSQQVSLQAGIHNYLLSGEFGILPDISSLLMFLRFIRNALIPLLQNNTLIVLILAIISFVKLFNMNRNLFIATGLWVFPVLIANSWFNPLLSGRHGIIGEFGIAFLVALLLKKRKTLFLFLILYILIIFLPALSLLKQPIPYLTGQSFIKTLPRGLLIESHFARPQIQGNYQGRIFFVNEPGEKKELEALIDKYLKNNKPVFITSQALSDPYGLYTGPFLFPLSLSYAKEFELKDIVSSYSTEKYITIDEDAGLIIYKIISKEKSQYPNIPILKYSRRRIDYFDPISQLWSFAERARIIQIHNIIKG